jgi:hypothetical protein
MATSIPVLNYFAFFTLFIIGFVFIYEKFSEIIGFYLLIIVNIAFFFYVLNDLMKILETSLHFVPMLAIFAVIVGSVFHTVLLVFILMVVTNLKGKFEKKKGAPLQLPVKYANKMEIIKRFMITCFCLGFIILYNLFYYKPPLEQNFAMLLTYFTFKSPTDNTFTKNSSLYLTLAASLILMGMSSKQVFDGNEFSKLSRQELMDG